MTQLKFQIYACQVRWNNKTLIVKFTRQIKYLQNKILMSIALHQDTPFQGHIADQIQREKKVSTQRDLNQWPLYHEAILLCYPCSPLTTYISILATQLEP